MYGSGPASVMGNPALGMNPMMMGRGMNISPDKIGGSYGIPMGI